MDFLKSIDLSHFKDIIGSQKIWTIVGVALTLHFIGVPQEKIVEIVEVALPALLVAHGIQAGAANMKKEIK